MGTGRAAEVAVGAAARLLEQSRAGVGKEHSSVRGIENETGQIHDRRMPEFRNVCGCREDLRKKKVFSLLWWGSCLSHALYFAFTGPAKMEGKLS